MRRRKALRRRTLWLGFVAVLVPLAVLLGLQYRWLVRLDHTSAIVHRATLDNFLEGVLAEVTYSYRWTGERLLNPPAYVFTQDRLDKAVHAFRGKKLKGVRRLFVVSFSESRDGQPWFYDPASGALKQPAWSPEVRAVYVATAPWRILAHKGGALETAGLAVEERDPEHRILLNPITDDRGRIVGVAGMILDSDDLRRRLLPAAIDKALPKFLAEENDPCPVVTVRDGRGRLVYSSSPDGGTVASEVEKAFPFVFKDWKIGIASRYPTAGEWARTNFVLNIAFSAALAALLLGGLALALRTASREMRLSQMKSDFVSNVSHELRTPLASIRVFGELLRLGRVESPRKVREYGEYIETESRRLTQLINNLLDFSSIESGRKRYHLERVDLEEVVRQTLRTFEVRLRQSGFRVSFEGPAAPLPEVVVDPGAIGQSLSNLLDNALKYSNGNREVAVVLTREDDCAVISVQDWGIGIPRDEQEKIFDRFHRVSTGLVHDVKGSGLGLAIVAHIARAHGGRVTVESRPGRGSTFSIHLPLEARRPAPEPGAVAAPPRGRPSEA